MTAGDLRELPETRPLGEADDPKVRLVHPEEDGGLGPDRSLVVGRTRPVRRPDLDQPRARAREHLRDPEAVAYLDQLAARDHDLATFCEGSQGQKHRRGVVVDDERGLGAGELAKGCGEMVLPRPTGARGEVVLEVRVAAGGLANPLEGFSGERGASEVRVHDHARRVQHPAKAWGGRRV